MAVEARGRVVSLFSSHPELEGDIVKVRDRLVEMGKGRIEGFRHVQAVQPHLIGIGLLVPEGAGLGAGLSVELLTGRQDRFRIADVRRDLVQGNQRPGGTDMVQIVILQLVFPADAPVFVQDTVKPGMHIGVEFRDVIGARHVQETAQFQARGIIPLVATFLSIQESGLGSPLDLRTHHPDGHGFRLRRAGRNQQSRP